MSAAPSEAGLFASLRQLLLTLAAIGRTRLALLANEAEEEKLRLVRMLVLALAALFLTGLSLVLLVAFATVALWDQRVLVLGLAAALVLGATVVVVLQLKAAARRGAGLFRSSLAELDADIQQLKQSLKGESGGPKAG